MTVKLVLPLLLLLLSFIMAGSRPAPCSITGWLRAGCFGHLRSFLLVGRWRHFVSASHSSRQHPVWPGRSVRGPPARGPVPATSSSSQSHSNTQKHCVTKHTVSWGDVLMHTKHTVYKHGIQALHTVYCTLHTVYCIQTLYTHTAYKHCIQVLHTVYCTLYTAYCIQNTVHKHTAYMYCIQALHTVYCTLYTVYCIQTLYTNTLYTCIQVNTVSHISCCVPPRYMHTCWHCLASRNLLPSWLMYYQGTD